MNAYWIGQVVHLSVTFTVDDVLDDPSEVLATVRKPDGTQTEYRFSLSEVTRESIGVYSVDVTTDAAGYWRYRFDGDGIEAIAEGKFYVKASEAI